MPEILRHFQAFRKAFASAFRSSCRSLNLDIHQAAVLKALAELGPSPAVDLSQATLLDPATVNRTVAEAVKRGWVRQVKDTRDRRCCRLTLTDEGLGVARRVLRRIRRLERHALSPFSPEERSRLGRDLTLLTERLASVDGNA